MLKRVLTYFLLTLVVLQSAVAMGDAHQLHQSGAEHLVFDDTHLHDDGHVADVQANHPIHPRRKIGIVITVVIVMAILRRRLIATERVHLATFFRT